MRNVGAMSFSHGDDGIVVEFASNQSSGYCPEPNSSGSSVGEVREVDKQVYWAAELSHQQPVRCLSFRVFQTDLS